MKPEEALKVLTNATAGLNGNRQDHLTVLEALKVIEGLMPKPAPAPVQAVTPPNSKKA